MNSAPVLWGVVPFGVALGLLIFRRWERQVNWIGAIFMLVLAGSVWVIPVNRAVRFGPWAFRLGEVFEVLGRRFVVTDADRGVFFFLYFLAGLCFLGALAARPGHLFVPLGMFVVVFWAGALVVEPFLYAALFLEIAMIMSVPFLHPPGKTASQGVLRYLAFQTLGMPFILFTGWMLGQVNPELISSQQLVLPTAMVGFGFAFLLAVFPFHTWLPMLAEEVHPYAATFIFLMLPIVVALFGLGFLNEFSWLRNSPSVDAILQGVGFLMTLTGGLWAALDFSGRHRFVPHTERNLGRILGYAVVIGTGVSLLAIRLARTEGLELFFALLFPRALGYLLWVLALTYLRERCGTLDFSQLQGVGRKLPATTVTLLLGQFSVAGFPMLAGFPAHWRLLEPLAGTNLIGTLGVMIGSLGLLVAGLRTLAVLVMIPKNEPEEFESGKTLSESPGWKILFVLGIVMLILLGLFPQWIAPLTARMPLAFPKIGP